MIKLIQSISKHYQFITASPKLVNVELVKPSLGAKACFLNAQKVAFKKECNYVLGFINVNGIPIEHAWNYKDTYFDYTLTKPYDYYELIQVNVKVLKLCVKTLGDGYVDLYGLNKVMGKVLREHPKS